MFFVAKLQNFKRNEVKKSEQYTVYLVSFF